MAGFDDSLVREYFEMNGFFVRQSRKYAVQSRRKRADEEGDLLVINPSPRRGGETPFQLFSSDLPGLSAAVVAVKAWHTTKAITPTMIKKGDLLEFVRKEAVEAAKEAFAEQHLERALGLVQVAGVVCALAAVLLIVGGT